VLPRLPPFDAVVVPIQLAISRSLCCALHAARHLSTAALFRLKIASSGRGALARTRCAHLSYENKMEDSANIEGPREDQHHDKKPRSIKTRRRRQRLTNISVPSWGTIGSNRAGGHE
jgi:hypothetical protein